MIRFACPKCQETNRRADEDAGQVISCAGCKQKLRVPTPKKTESKPTRPAPKEEVIDELEEVPKSASRRTTQAPDADAEEREAEEAGGGEEEVRPRKKKAAEVLGPRKATFQPRQQLLRILLVVFALTSAGGVLCLLLAVVGVLVDGGAALSFFMIPTGIIGFLWCLSILSLKVVLHEGGLCHSHRGKRRLIPWEDIHSVKQAVTEHYHNGGYVGTTYFYTLELEDGTRIVYTNYRLQKVEKLGNEIMDKTSQVLFPRLLRAYEKGKVVDFGPLGLSQDGLHYGSKRLEWDKITGIKVNEGYIAVSKRGKWFNWCNIAASSIPNLLVFLSLVNQVVGVDDG